MARKVDRVAYYEKQMEEWLKEADKAGRGQQKVRDAVRNQFLRELRDATLEAYEESMNEMGLVPDNDLDVMLWSTDLDESIVIDKGKLWVKPGGVLIMYEDGAIPSPGTYPESDVPWELQDSVSAYIASHFSPRAYIDDINNAVGMVAVDSETLGVKEVMRTA